MEEETGENKKNKINSFYLRLTMPIREMVAGEACIKSCVSKMKLTLSLN